MMRRFLAVCLPGIAAVPVCFADSVLEFQTTEFSGGQAVIGTVQISTSGDNTRLEIISVSSSEAGGMIFHGGRNELIILDHAQGSYLIVDQERMNAMASQPGSPVAQATGEQPRDTINSLGSHSEVAGTRCRNFEVVRHGRKIRELCVSEWQDIAGGHETADALKRVVDFFEEMRLASAGVDGMDVFDRQRELLGYMTELDGYPVLDRDFSANGGLERQTLMTSAREEAQSPAFFEPPKGYRQMELPERANQ